MPDCPIPVFRDAYEVLLIGRMATYNSQAEASERIPHQWRSYRKRHQLLGLNTSAIDAVRGAKILSQLTPLFESRGLRKPRIAERYPLADGAQAYDRLASAPGKIVLVMNFSGCAIRPER